MDDGFLGTPLRVGVGVQSRSASALFKCTPYRQTGLPCLAHGAAMTTVTSNRLAAFDVFLFKCQGHPQVC